MHPDRRNSLCHQVRNPSDYGVVEFNEKNEALSIERNHPIRSRTTQSQVSISTMNESWISRKASNRRNAVNSDNSVNCRYLELGDLNVEILGEGGMVGHRFIRDASASGTVRSTLEARQGLSIACPEEIAWRNGWIDDAKVSEIGKIPRKELLWSMSPSDAEKRG